MEQIKHIEYNARFAANKFLYSFIGPMPYIHDDEFLLFNGITHLTRHLALWMVNITLTDMWHDSGQKINFNSWGTGHNASLSKVHKNDNNITL
jgi:hypothetical protein